MWAYLFNNSYHGTIMYGEIIMYGLVLFHSKSNYIMLGVLLWNFGGYSPDFNSEIEFKNSFL